MIRTNTQNTDNICIFLRFIITFAIKENRPVQKIKYRYDL